MRVHGLRCSKASASYSARARCQPQHIVAGVRFHWSREEKRFQRERFMCRAWYSLRQHEREGVKPGLYSLRQHERECVKPGLYSLRQHEREGVKPGLYSLRQHEREGVKPGLYSLRQHECEGARRGLSAMEDLVFKLKWKTVS